MKSCTGQQVIYRLGEGGGRGFTCLPEIWQWVGSGANSAIKADDQDANLL